MYVQGAADSRMLPDDLNHWYVRNASGEMVAFAFAKGRWVYGSPMLERFNGMSAVQVTGAPVAGVSSGTALDIVEQFIKELPPGIGYEWSGMSHRKASGASSPIPLRDFHVGGLLALAALYESWSIPFAVMLVVPLGAVGALLATYTRGLSNDVYFQVGLLTTLACRRKMPS